MASKGKGKEQPAATATTSASTSSSSSSKPASTPAAAPARRTPIGKVIHYFADNQTQGYDGNKFQEAYGEVVKRAMDQQQRQALTGTSEGKDEEEGETVPEGIKEEDMQALIAMTGLPKDDSQALFTKAKSNSLEEACRVYLHPESFSSHSNGTNESSGNDVAVVA